MAGVAALPSLDPPVDSGYIEDILVKPRSMRLTPQRPASCRRHGCSTIGADLPPFCFLVFPGEERGRDRDDARRRRACRPEVASPRRGRGRGRLQVHL